MIKLVVLGSGSKGNSIYMDIDGWKILIDVGFTKKEINKRLATFGRDFSEIENIFITHDHKDHFAPWIRKENHDITSYIGSELAVSSRLVTSFPVSHDSDGGALGYTFKDKAGNKVGIIMDTGCVTEEMLEQLFDCAVICIETNNDIDMLAVGKYKTELLERIASDTGHLRNECAAEAIESVDWPGLQYIVCMHLSAAHNNPDLVRFCMASTGTKAEIIIAEQNKVSKMITVM